MDKIVEAIKNNPVRVMELVTAICAVLAFYFGNVPWPLVIAVFAALIGGGETVRAKVTPMRKLRRVEHPIAIMNLPDNMNSNNIYEWPAK